MTEYGYNADSLVDYIKSPEGNETSMTFDGPGRLLTETDPAGGDHNEHLDSTR